MVDNLWRLSLRDNFRPLNLSHSYSWSGELQNRLAQGTLFFYNMDFAAQCNPIVNARCRVVAQHFEILHDLRSWWNTVYDYVTCTRWMLTKRRVWSFNLFSAFFSPDDISIWDYLQKREPRNRFITKKKLLIIQRSHSMGWSLEQVFAMLKQQQAKEKCGLTLLGEAMCHRAFRILVGIAKSRMHRLRKAVLGGAECCPHDNRYVPKRGLRLHRNKARAAVAEFLTQCYHVQAEPMPEAVKESETKVGLKPVKRRGKRPRSAFKKNSTENGYPDTVKFLPPGTLGDYHEQCQHEYPDIKISRKTFCRAPGLFINVYEESSFLNWFELGGNLLECWLCCRYGRRASATCWWSEASLSILSAINAWGTSCW